MKLRNYWTEENISKELKLVIENLGYFPKYGELSKINPRLISVIDRYGGINKFRKLLGYNYIHNPKNYWSEDKIIEELKQIIIEIGHFPTQLELSKSKNNVLYGINKNGGIEKFRKLLGLEPIQNLRGYWTFENILKELKEVIEKIGHFPTKNELLKLNRRDLSSVIDKFNGINKFRKILNYSTVNERNYWNDETIIKELKKTMNELGHYPTLTELENINRIDLFNAIGKNGKTNKFRILLKQPIIRKIGYYTDTYIISELKQIINKLDHFPSYQELIKLEHGDLGGAILRFGGINKFRKLCGFNISLFEKYKSELLSYIVKRGYKTEKFLKQILQDYCLLHNLPEPLYNKKLSKGNVIEFVCNTNKTIGIDVTNTKCKNSIPNKWKHHDYHKHLDELWIVVFSNIFSNEDYIQLNLKSPNNVRVISIDEFLIELDYPINKILANKIDNFKSCTFWTKNEYLNKLRGEQ